MPEEKSQQRRSSRRVPGDPLSLLLMSESAQAEPYGAENSGELQAELFPELAQSWEIFESQPVLSEHIDFKEAPT